MSESGSDGTPPLTKKRIRRVVIMSSGSDSDSDDSVGPSRIRRKRLRVLSDQEQTSDSSSGSSVLAGIRRKRSTVPGLRESDVDSDSSGHASASEIPTETSIKIVSGFTSDSSDGNSEKCSICLLRFKDQEVGTPSTCEHIFCLDCIKEWSKNVNTCPVDRIEFKEIIARECLGGRVVEVCGVDPRPSSVDLLVEEDPTFCEVCGSENDENTMLLCDGCDLAFHMQCLQPPLQQIPVEQWFCPTCTRSDNYINVAELHDLLLDIDGPLPSGVRPSQLREPRNVRRSSRTAQNANGPSSSNDQRSHNIDIMEGPSVSRASTSRMRTQTVGRKRKKYRRRRKTKTIVIGYEVGGDGKFPVIKKVEVKRRAKKRKVKKSRTAARRAYVRASVRARLASLHPVTATASVSLDRHSVGMTNLSLFGDPYQLDYFPDDDEADSVAEGTAFAVATRPTSHILSAYRQARRKTIAIPTPHASPAPDLLSSILESQTLLHSKGSDVSISVDGRVTIKLQKKGEIGTDRTLKTKSVIEKKDDKVDLSKGGEARKVPSYPGQARGGGWGGGGYRGQYAREQSGPLNRQQHYENNAARHNNATQHQNMWQDDSNSHTDYLQHPPHYPDNEIDRRRPPPHRAPGPSHRYNEQNRSSLGPSWQPYSHEGPFQREPPMQHHMRQSFGGFENPLDMRLSHDLRNQNSAMQKHEEFHDNTNVKTQSPSKLPPLPEPPVFRFDKLQDAIEKSEEEGSDSGLVIDTEKYDPTEPTVDEDSNGVEHNSESPTGTADMSVEGPIQNIVTEMDTNSLNIPPNILDNAVKQVLQEHPNLIMPNQTIQSALDKSDEEWDGDCPNFSIYSATSVHIANNSSSLISEAAPKEKNLVDYPSEEDLVQEDDEVASPVANIQHENDSVYTYRKESNDYLSSIPPGKPVSDFNDKVSKRCPITPNKRNPIKIKLHTPTLIKRQVSLYDEEDIQEAIIENTEINVSTDIVTSNVITEVPDKVFDSESDHKQTENATNDAKGSQRPDTYHETIANKLNDIIESEEMSQSSNTGLDTAESIGHANTPDEPNKCDLDDDISENSKDTPENEDTEQTADTPDHDNNELSENELNISGDSKRDPEAKNEEVLEKMTESISETEDERSYTPCLDENKSKDTSLETEKENIGIEGLDTEMISEEEGNEIFSDADKAESEKTADTPLKDSASVDHEEGEILEKRKELADLNNKDDVKKKRKKEPRKEGKDRSKGKRKKTDISFKKLSKSGKERNYREKDEKNKSKRARHSSSDREREKAKKKEKRKDLERYDVRTVVTEKRRRLKDAFGRDISPGRRTKSPSLPHSPNYRGRSNSKRRSISHSRRSGSRAKASPTRFKSLSPLSSPRNTSPGRPYVLVMRRSPSERRRRVHSKRSTSRGRKSISRSPSVKGTLLRKSFPRRSLSRGRRKSLSPRARRSISRGMKSKRTPSPRRKSISPRRRRSVSRKRNRRISSRSPKPKPTKKKKRSRSRPRSHSKEKRVRRGRRKSKSPRRKSPKQKKKKKSVSPELELSPERCAWRGSPASPTAAGYLPVWSHSERSINSRLLSPGWTPPPDTRRLRLDDPIRKDKRKRQRELDLARLKHGKDISGSSKEVFTSGNNILVSVSFNDTERAQLVEDGGAKRKRRKNETKRERRERRKKRIGAITATDSVKPVAIIDLEKSPFREITPSPKNVIVLSDSDHGDKEAPPPAEAPAVAEPPPSAAGPKTPPSPEVSAPASAPIVKFNVAPKPAPVLRAVNPLREEEPVVPEVGTPPAEAAPPSPASSRDAYDPFEPTKSPEPAPTAITLETAQRTNLSADDVVNQRPVSPLEKVLALLQSTRDVSPSRPPPPAQHEVPATPRPDLPAALLPAPRIMLPETTRGSPLRQQPKLFLAKPSPIKSNPIKPLQTTKISKLPMPTIKPMASRRGETIPLDDSPYSPGSSDFGDLFSPPSHNTDLVKSYKKSGGDVFDSLFVGKIKSRKSNSAKVPVKQIRKKGKMQVGVKMDEDNLKVMDELPSSAVEMQVKSKFLKKLNRQERVVEEVKFVLKPYYNKKRLSKEDYKDILRRCVPKICHNKSGEINPSKIQALVEAYVRKFRKKHKLGLM